jgi:hypothetical protein
MRRLRVALAVAGVCVVAAACSGSPKTSAPASSSSPSSSAPPPAPVAVSALEGLLLSPADINTALGATAMTSVKTRTAMSDDSSTVADQDCRAIDNPAEASPYAGSGWTSVSEQDLQEPGDQFTHVVRQAVVSFPSATAAAAFFDASTHRWPACANRQYTETQPGKPDAVWTVGPISVTASTLSNTQTWEGHNGWACQRALTVRNNVAVDVLACSYGPADTAVTIAHQIAAKIPT